MTAIATSIGSRESALDRADYAEREADLAWTAVEEAS